MKFSTSILLLFFLCLSGGRLFAQSSYQIEGAVTDPEQAPLTGATVVALNPLDSTLLSFAITDGEGRFVLNRISLPEVTLQVTYIGYGTFRQSVVNPEEEARVTVGEIWLSPENLLLEEVVVEARHVPVVLRGDTVQYNAAAYNVQADDNVERLLKQLPGVQVERDGSIKAQGEDVDQVLVDGKPFFGGNAQIATRNLPADAVDKVEVYDEASEMEEFSGVADGQEEKTINLVLKEDKKKGQFGEVSAGYGTDGRYQGKASINRFSGASQLSLLGSANNLNEPGFSVFDYIDFLGGFERMMSQGGGRVSIDQNAMGVPLDFGDGGGVNTTQALGLNYNRDFGENTTFSSNYFGNILRRELSENYSRTNFLEEGTYRTLGRENENSHTSGHRLNAELRHELSERQRLILRARLGYTDGLTTSDQFLFNFDALDQLVSESDQRYDYRPNRYQLGMELTYLLKFGTEGRVFTTNLAYDRSQAGATENLRNRDLFTDPITNELLLDSLDQRQLTEQPTDEWQLRLNFTEPLSDRWYWQNTLTGSYAEATIDKTFLDRTETDEFVTNAPLSGTFELTFSTGSLSTGLLRNIQRTRLSFGAEVQRARLVSGTIPARDYTYLLPRIGWEYESTNSRDLSLNYRTQIVAPTLDQLRPLLENSNSLSLYTGNPLLDPEYRHDGILGFSIIDAFSFTNFFLNLRSSYIEDRIVNELTIDENLRQLRRPVNSDYEWQNQLNTSFSTPLPWVDVALRLRGGVGYTQGQLLVNATVDRAERWQQDWSLSFSNRKQEVATWEVGAAWTYGQARYRERVSFNQNYSRRDWFAKADVFLPNNWTLSTEAEHRRYSSEAFGRGDNFTIWQASIRKSILAGQRLTLRLTVFDLLNQNQGLERRNAFNYFEESRANALGRYAMLTATYKLSRVGE